VALWGFQPCFPKSCKVAGNIRKQKTVLITVREKKKKRKGKERREKEHRWGNSPAVGRKALSFAQILAPAIAGGQYRDKNCAKITVRENKEEREGRGSAGGETHLSWAERPSPPPNSWPLRLQRSV
jgi:hypothetical protein